MATRVTEGARRERHEKERLFFFLFSVCPPRFARLAASPRPRACTALTKSEEKERDCSQSTYRIGVHTLPNSFSCRHEELSGSLRASSRFTRPNGELILARRLAI